MMLNYAGGFHAAVDRVVELEKAGLDVVWIAEAYSADAISQVGYLAAKTSRVEIGTGIVNVYSRTAALMAMTAAGCDYVSNGRFILGLGASGPQVIEGFHGVPYEKPMQRIKEYIDACRMIWKREQPFQMNGQTVKVPLPAGEGTGLGKPLKIIAHPRRADIPIWIAALGPKNVEMTAEIADGWMPIFFLPDRANDVWGADLASGTSRRDPSLSSLEITAGGLVAIGDDAASTVDLMRPMAALYIGGMGAKGRNFYNDLLCRYGWEAEAERIQDLYLDGKKDEAAALVPEEFLRLTNLCGPEGFVRERLAAFADAGVTVLNVQLVGGDPVATIDKLRSWM